jgi:esterase
MKLFSRHFGEGQPLIILHGLFGISDNWLTVGKKLGEQYSVYLLDQRNHGQSPHSDEFTYKAMSDDLLEFIEDNKLVKPILIGHSMGGKTVMEFASEHPNKLDKLIVVDIAPKAYPVYHREIIDGLLSLNLDEIKTRKEADEQLSKSIPEESTKQFLLKNLYWENDVDDNPHLAWRMNLSIIDKNIDIVGIPLAEDAHYFGDTLFIRGGNSGYIKDADMDNVKHHFPKAILVTIPNAGHWVQAEQPMLFYNAVIDFIQS